MKAHGVQFERRAALCPGEQGVRRDRDAVEVRQRYTLLQGSGLRHLGDLEFTHVLRGLGDLVLGERNADDEHLRITDVDERVGAVGEEADGVERVGAVLGEERVDNSSAVCGSFGSGFSIPGSSLTRTTAGSFVSSLTHRTNTAHGRFLTDSTGCSIAQLVRSYCSSFDIGTDVFHQRHELD